MLWGPEIAQWPWGWKRGATWGQNRGDWIIGLGHWVDLGNERRTQRGTETYQAASNRVRQVRRENRFGGGEGPGGGRWFILFCAGGVLGAGELPVSHLCSVLFTITATVPDALSPASLWSKRMAAFYSPAEWSPPVDFIVECLMHYPCHLVFLNPVSPACAPIHISMLGVCGISIWWFYNWHNHNSISSLYECS